MIDYTIIVPLITVIISVIASVIVATMRNRAELNKIYKELEQRYAKSIFDKRVEVYPSLYELTSSYQKTIQYKECNRDTLRNLRTKIDDWNSKNSIFFSYP